MKSQFRSVLFVLLVGACGGDREPKSSPTIVDYIPALPKQQPVVETTVVDKGPEPVKVVLEPVLPTKYEDAMTEGRAMAAKGENDKAKELFEQAAKLDGKKAEPQIELARIYIAKGERGLAIKHANKGVKLAPESSQAWNTKGRAELARFSYDDAIEAFTKAVELNRDNVWAWNNLGYTELQLKKYDEAAEHLLEATSKKGATGYMFNNLGIALEQLDRLDEARTAFDAGGKLGSKEAVASRKRLEGVKTIAIAKHETAAVEPEQVEKVENVDKGYELNNEPTEDSPEQNVDDEHPEDEMTTDDAQQGSGEEVSDSVPTSTM